MSEEKLEDTFVKILDKFDEDIERLSKIPEQTKEHTKALSSVLYNHKIFYEPSLFKDPMIDLYDDVGHAYTTVLLIDLERQRISPSKAKQYLDAFKQVNQSQSGQPVVIQPNAPNLGILSGYWYYKASQEIAKGARSDIPAVANITSEQPVTDVLEHGRQLIPNLNLLNEVFETDILLVQRRNDLNTLNILMYELRLFCTNLFGVISSFSRAGVDYRKELVGNRKQDTAKAVMALKMAEFQSMGQITQRDIYQMLKEAGGSDTY